MKHDKLEAEREEEEACRLQLMAKFAEDDRIEQLNAHKRRMKQQEHKRSVEALLEERREKVRAEKEKEHNNQMREKQVALNRAKIVEEERQQLLEKHVKNLLGYLPKGVLRDTDDIERFGAPSSVEPSSSKQ